MTNEEDPAGKGDGMRVFGAPQQRRRAQPAAHWLRAGLLAFVGIVNLVGAIVLFGGGFYLLATSRAEGDVAKAELQLGSFSIRATDARTGDAMTPQQRGRESLAVVCFALALVPLGVAVLSFTQYQMAREVALLHAGQPAPEPPK